MRWQHGLLQSRGQAPPLGLNNLGNTCYLNSVLQCLTYTPPLANFSLRSLHSSVCTKPQGGQQIDDMNSYCSGRRTTDCCPFCILEKRITRSLTLDAACDVPSEICSCLHLYASDFELGYQEDAHELLHYIINALHNTCLLLGVTKRTVVQDIFGGALLGEVECLSCGFISRKTEELFDVSLDISKSSSVYHSFRSFFQVELLDGANKYHCSNCSKLSPANKYTSILHAPSVLLVQLKQFDWSRGGKKLHKHVSFQELLVLSDFMSRGRNEDAGEPTYNLFGMIIHLGSSTHSGHYYCYVKDPYGDWYCCDDTRISLSSMEEVLSQRPYILFYLRSDETIL